ncbi:MAG TPA: AraC family transcriptional regulator [Kiritimatiellia bacterium]|nr:AraC family transcriptional regulator [Kiritimatiellia bacterium]
MDEIFIHLRPLPRRFPGGNRVSSVGYIARKRSHVRRAFSTVNFSFILSGRGAYRYGGREFAVEAPALILQWPGATMDYGPARGGAWEELFLIYEITAADAAARWGFRPADRPVWPIRSSRMIGEQTAWLLAHLREADAPGMADRFDAVCERLILEALLGGPELPGGAPEDAVSRIHDLLVRQLDRDHDIDQLARDHHLSPMTFRRRWARRYGLPPHRYIMQNRMREACRLLAETAIPIKAIAPQLGFPDPLYFSRRFRRENGLPASAYRTLHRVKSR